MRVYIRSVASMLLACACVSPLAAQSTNEPRYQAGIQFTTASSSEFEENDYGVGGRLSWNPTTMIGIEGELAFYPGDFGSPRAFSASRVEGLFGATIGPRKGRIRPFAKVRPGFLRFSEAPAPFPCILIYPPPLRCTMASGPTLGALDIGGGAEWLGDRTFIRLDAGDRMLRYPGPSIDQSNQVHDDKLLSHDFRVAIGGGLRF